MSFFRYIWFSSSFQPLAAAATASNYEHLLAPMQHCIFFSKNNHRKYFYLLSQTPTWPETISVTISSLRRLTSWCSDCCSHKAHKWKHSGKVPLFFWCWINLRLVFHMLDPNIFLDRMDDWMRFPDKESHWICESFSFQQNINLVKTTRIKCKIHYRKKVCHFERW